jgi:hypothetical protein
LAFSAPFTARPALFENSPDWTPRVYEESLAILPKVWGEEESLAILPKVWGEGAENLG